MSNGDPEGGFWLKNKKIIVNYALLSGRLYLYMRQHMRFWYLPHCLERNAQMGLCKYEGSLEPVLAYTGFGCRCRLGTMYH